MDKECITLCRAINEIPGVKTVESCCGHGGGKFKIWFKVDNLEKLPVLLYYCDPCHVGFSWNCFVKTDCGMSPVTFSLQSESIGEASYKEAQVIAACVTNFLRGRINGKR